MQPSVEKGGYRMLPTHGCKEDRDGENAWACCFTEKQDQTCIHTEISAF